jgi:hypothetical protein
MVVVFLFVCVDGEVWEVIFWCWQRFGKDRSHIVLWRPGLRVVSGSTYIAWCEGFFWAISQHFSANGDDAYGYCKPLRGVDVGTSSTLGLQGENP